MSTRAIWALPGIPDEPAMVSAAASVGLSIVRRCVDAADLLACAVSEPQAPVVLSASVPRIDAEIIGRIAAGGRVVIGVCADPRDAERLDRWGISAVIDAMRPDAVAAIAAVITADRHRPDVLSAPSLPMPMQMSEAKGVWAPQPPAVDDASTPVSPGPDRERQAGPGPVIAVWGTPGAPGTSRTALGIADELARAGHDTCLVDADVAAASLAIILGVVDEISGLLVACRQADGGILTPASVRQASRLVRPRLSVLTGVDHPAQGAQVRPSAIALAIGACARAFDVVVVDAGTAPVGGPSIARTTGDHDRDACAQAALDAASARIAVARDDALGLARVVRAWPTAPPADALALVSAPGASRGGRRALIASGIAVPVEPIPWERGWSRALAQGASLGEVAPRASARRAYRALAEFAGGVRERAGR